MNSLESTFLVFARFALGRDSPSFTRSSTPGICKFMFPLFVSIWLCFFVHDFHLFSKPHVSDFPTSLSSRRFKVTSSDEEESYDVSDEEESQLEPVPKMISRTLSRQD